MIHLGIDPGKKGAIAVIVDGIGEPHAYVWDTPLRSGAYDVEGMVAAIRGALVWAVGGGIIDPGELAATIEGGRVMPTRIKRGDEWVDTHQSAKTAAEQWRGIGLWQGILAAKRIPTIEVAPSAWKRRLGVTGSAMTLRERKELSIVKARKLFPAAAHLIYRARDDGRAEALLIAEDGRRLRAQ